MFTFYASRACAKHILAFCSIPTMDPEYIYMQLYTYNQGGRKRGTTFVSIFCANYLSERQRFFQAAPGGTLGRDLNLS